jgi:hypothetical protein
VLRYIFCFVSVVVFAFVNNANGSESLLPNFNFSSAATSFEIPLPSNPMHLKIDDSGSNLLDFGAANIPAISEKTLLPEFPSVHIPTIQSVVFQTPNNLQVPVLEANSDLDLPAYFDNVISITADQFPVPDVKNPL